MASSNHKTVSAGITFILSCECCGKEYIITAEEAINGPEFCCHQCGECTDLVEAFAIALQEFADESLDDIWLSTQVRKNDPWPDIGWTPFDPMQ